MKKSAIVKVLATIRPYADDDMQWGRLYKYSWTLCRSNDAQIRADANLLYGIASAVHMYVHSSPSKNAKEQDDEEQHAKELEDEPSVRLHGLQVLA